LGEAAGGRMVSAIPEEAEGAQKMGTQEKTGSERHAGRVPQNLNHNKVGEKEKMSRGEGTSANQRNGRVGGGAENPHRWEQNKIIQKGEQVWEIKSTKKERATKAEKTGESGGHRS